MGARRSITEVRAGNWNGRAMARHAARVAGLALGAGLLTVAAAGPVWADSGSGSGSNSSSGGTAGGASLLGGWTIGSSASGMSVFYNQPNFPIPAKPSLEFNLGYSTATYNSGPVGEANGSALWPGAIVAGGGSQLPLLLDPYIEDPTSPFPAQLAPLTSVVSQLYKQSGIGPNLEPLVPNVGNWPIQAVSAYPQGPATANNQNGPFVMSSTADQNSSTATSSVGLVGGSPGQSAIPASMLAIQAIGSNVSDTVDNQGEAVSQAASTIHGIDIAGGLIHIGEVSSLATATSDGNQAKLAGSSSVIGVTVAGESVTVDSNGLHAAANNQNLLGSLQPQAGQILSTAGITMTLTNPTDSVQGASASRELDGLQITIDLSTFDQGLSTLIAQLPSQITSGLSSLPAFPPYKQVITLDLGWVKVNSAASPPFTLSLNDLGGGSADLGNLTAASGGLTPSSFGGSTPSLTGSLPQVSSSPATILNAKPASLFKGIGAAAIVIGLLLAAALVAMMVGADRAVGKLADAPICTGEDVGSLG